LACFALVVFSYLLHRDFIIAIVIAVVIVVVVIVIIIIIIMLQSR